MDRFLLGCVCMRFAPLLPPLCTIQPLDEGMEEQRGSDEKSYDL